MRERERESCETEVQIERYQYRLHTAGHRNSSCSKLITLLPSYIWPAECLQTNTHTQRERDKERERESEREKSDNMKKKDDTRIGAQVRTCVCVIYLCCSDA